MINFIKKSWDYVLKLDTDLSVAVILISVIATIVLVIAAALCFVIWTAPVAFTTRILVLAFILAIMPQIWYILHLHQTKNDER